MTDVVKALLYGVASLLLGMVFGLVVHSCIQDTQRPVAPIHYRSLDYSPDPAMILECSDGEHICCCTQPDGEQCCAGKAVCSGSIPGCVCAR